MLDSVQAEASKRARIAQRASHGTGTSTDEQTASAFPASAGRIDDNKRSKKRSKVWGHFREILDEDGRITHVQCLLCTQPALQWCGCTSNLRNHMAAAHKEEFIQLTEGKHVAFVQSKKPDFALFILH